MTIFCDPFSNDKMCPTFRRFQAIESFVRLPADPGPALRRCGNGDCPLGPLGPLGMVTTYHL